MKKQPKSKIWLTEALFYLLKTKSFSKITINDIAKKAGVSRLTFYRNFNSKEDILQQRFDTLFDNFYNDITKNNITSVRDTILLVFSYWYKNQEYLKILIDNKLEKNIYTNFNTYILRIFNKLNIAEFYSPEHITFISGGLFFSMINWIEGNCQQSPKEITNSIIKILKSPQ